MIFFLFVRTNLNFPFDTGCPNKHDRPSFGKDVLTENN